MSAASLPGSGTITPTPRRGRALLGAIVLYIVLVLLAAQLERDDLAALAVVVLAGGALAPALCRGARRAWWAFAATALAAVAAAWHGMGWLLVDAVPALINGALCLLFARSLRRGRAPLIARFIAILEGPQRLAEPRVATYARGLTACWALVLAAQAALLGAIALAQVGIGPAALGAAAWRAYLHVGSGVVVGALLAGEYGYRRWHLRGLAHPALATFLVAIVRQWPALLRSALDDTPRDAP